MDDETLRRVLKWLEDQLQGAKTAEEAASLRQRQRRVVQDEPGARHAELTRMLDDQAAES